MPIALQKVLDELRQDASFAARTTLRTRRTREASAQRESAQRDRHQSP